MSIQKDRLISLIEFSLQSAKMRSTPIASVAAHRLFALYENEIQGLPGIRINVSDPNGGDEIWLAVKRLHETKPPDITSVVLRPWVQMTQGLEEPLLRETTDGASLIAAGTHCSSANPSGDDKPVIDPKAMVALSGYNKEASVKAQFNTYLDARWRPWARDEKLRRNTIRIYSKLFTLKQQLEDGIVEAQLELVWGVGLGIWNSNGSTVSYPVVGRLVELSLNPETAEVEIRPRDIDARIEVDWYASVNNPGVAKLEAEAKTFFKNATETFSPFDRGTFEPLLRTAVANLDANGIYWPDKVPAGDRQLPTPDDKLKVTDTWVIFARPRSANVFVQDLEKLKDQAQNANDNDYPPAVAAIVTDPATTSPDVQLTSFRGVSASYHAEGSASGKNARDLYFPKPFNDEQVRIVQLLEVYDGVVVQGPPGTGKTHTIANVICHYLAEGKRVLVTSMKDPALAVLQEQIPDDIRPLAISLLATEQEGMKQFEHAINKIDGELQGFNRIRTERDIKQLDIFIEDFHSKLASIDHKIGEWAKKNLAKVTLETEEIAPQDAAREVVENVGQFEWIPDALGITPIFEPQFSDADIVQLREARRALGKDIDYLGAVLDPNGLNIDFENLRNLHQKLSQFKNLKQGAENGDVPSLADSMPATLERAYQLYLNIEALRLIRDEIMQANRSWTGAMRERLRRGDNKKLLSILEALGFEIEQADERHKAFLARPVVAPVGIELDDEIAGAVSNLAGGKSPFGFKGLVGKSKQKQQLAGIRVLGVPPADEESWKHVADHLALLKHLRELALRWNTLAPSLQLDGVSGDQPESGLVAARDYALYLKVKRVVAAECELCTEASFVFPEWDHARDVADSAQHLSDLEKALYHHLRQYQLADGLAAKDRIQKMLDGQSGRVIEAIRRFLSETLGNPEIKDAQMKAEWLTLMTELSRVLELQTHLATVRDVCDRIEASGAPKYVALLKQPLACPVDGLLPDGWRSAWRLRRLATYLESIDVQKNLKKLAKDRHEVEKKLSHAYCDIVVKKTWLKLDANASNSIRSAMQAYLSAIKKIGKGGGVRAVRYRKDAREAASQAAPAVPCWIMSHYRVSESLPAELGCFDLVVVDEASQSDLTALPALLRAKKVLIVGDDKQVSPEGVGLEENKIRSLMSRFLGNQVKIYRQQMSPERSIYDLFKVVFANSAVMLKEHFRCVGPIIEYSKREFYSHELRPLRMPKASERLDPPLIDVVVEGGYRSRGGDVNLPEARFIVDEIKLIVSNPDMRDRSIGVVSLLGNKQALEIWNRLTDELGTDVMQRHRITCGDARTFQGKERDIMFLSMVATPTDCHALSGATYEQRFNVAASRGRDRMYLVRSVQLEDLSNTDLRCKLIKHFKTPFVQNESNVKDLRTLCESPFECEMYDELTMRGYWVTPQVRVGHYRIDMVVEGHNDARLAVECDGDKYHGPDKWAEDMQRQRVLERAGWEFWRCFASAFIRRRSEMLDDLVKTLAERGIEPIGAEGAPRSVHTELRLVPFAGNTVPQVGSVSFQGSGNVPSSPYVAPPVKSISTSGSVSPMGGQLPPPTDAGDLFSRGRVPVSSVKPRSANFSFSNYVEYAGPQGDDPRNVNMQVVSAGLVRIVEVEGPVVAKRVCDIYLRGCGIKRMGPDLKNMMNEALSYAICQGLLVAENESKNPDLVFSVVRVNGSPPIKLRKSGPRLLAEIPPSELQVVARCLAERDGFVLGSDEHLRAVLACFDLKRLTEQVGKTLQEILEPRFPYVDDFINQIPK